MPNRWECSAQEREVTLRLCVEEHAQRATTVEVQLRFAQVFKYYSMHAHTTRNRMALHGMAWHGMAMYGPAVEQSMHHVWHGMVWHGSAVEQPMHHVWHGTV
jgi:hypothetical protein